MSNFTPLVPFAIDFDGDHITMDLCRLKKKTMLKIGPHFDGEKGEDGKIVLAFEDQKQLLIMMEGILPEYVSNFDGLKMKDGTKILLEMALEQSYFMILTSAILSKLVEISNPDLGKKDDPKDNGEAGNSNGQAPEVTAG